MPISFPGLLIIQISLPTPKSGGHRRAPVLPGVARMIKITPQMTILVALEPVDFPSGMRDLSRAEA